MTTEIKLEQNIFHYVSLQEMKSYLRVSHDEDDALIKTCVEASTKFIQEYCQYLLCECIVTCLYDNHNRNILEFNRKSKIVYLPYRPIKRVLFIKTEDGIELGFKLDGDKVVILDDTFTKAFIIYKGGEREIPADLKLVLYKIAADMYFNRTTQVQMSTDTLNILHNYRVVYV
jgi:hypothetical protein